MQFNELLASIGKGPGTNGSTQPKPTTPTAAPRKPSALPNGAKPAGTNGGLDLKRKADDVGGDPAAKVARTEQNGGVSRPPFAQRTPSVPAANKSVPSPASTVPYRGTSRPGMPENTVKPAPKPVPKPAAAASAQQTAGSSTAPVKKSGYAGIMARAKAAEEAAKLAANHSIVHKPVEKLTKKERDRMRQEARENQKAGVKGGKMAGQTGRSRSGTPSDPKAATKKTPAPLAYSGTMRKPPAPLSYKGTMRAQDPAKPAKQPEAKTDKFGGKDKYGGYASWSDLDEAEDEDEEQYDSESDMEGGWDEMEREEAAAAASARKEDQEALEEENRHKAEKLARKKKLEMLSKQAKGKQRF